MSPERGRPSIENPIKKKLSIRLDADTETKLLAYCEQHGISKGEAIRRGIHLLLAQELADTLAATKK